MDRLFLATRRVSGRSVEGKSACHSSAAWRWRSQTQRAGRPSDREVSAGAGHHRSQVLGPMLPPIVLGRAAATCHDQPRTASRRTTTPRLKRRSSGNSSFNRIPWTSGRQTLRCSARASSSRWPAVRSPALRVSRPSASGCQRPIRLVQRTCRNHELTSALAPFQRICTPMHTSRNDVSCKITVIPVAPRTRPN